MRECETIQALISEMLDGELSEADAAAVRVHIAECDDCRAMYQAFMAVSAAVAAEEPVPEGLHKNIMSTVRTADQAMRSQKKLTRLRSVLSLAACLIVVVGTVLSLRSTLLSPKKSSEANYTGGSNYNNAPAMSSASDDMAKSEEIMDAQSVADPCEAPGGASNTAMDQVMPMATEAPEADGAVNEGTEIQLLTLEVTEAVEGRIMGKVAASGSGIFAVGQELTVILEPDTAIAIADTPWPVVEVEFDRWEDGVVYARSIRVAK